MIGSFIYGLLKAKSKEKYIYLSAILLNAVFSVFYVNFNLWYVAVTMLFIVGFSDGFQMVIFNTTIQKNFAAEDLGKVFASAYALIMSAQLFSMGVGGWLIDLVGYKVIVGIVAIIIILFSLVHFMLSKSEIKKQMESEVV